MRHLSTVYSACLSALLLGATLPAQAESFASSASSAGSASSGSVSDSLGESSDSSSRDKKVAEGEYRVIDVAEGAGKPEMVRLTVRATDPNAVREFFVQMPRQALGARPVGVNDLVQVRERPYGLEFARVDTREPFFLVLQDDWHRELKSNPVTL